MLANALIYPHFDYCSPVWSNINVEYSNSLQILQNKLARVLLSADIRTPIDVLMSSLNWDKLDKRWKNQLLVLVFKCLKHDAPSYLSSKFIFTSFTHSKNTRSQSSNSLVIPAWQIIQGKRTFLYRGSTFWNKLPTDVRCILSNMSVNTFTPTVIK